MILWCDGAHSPAENMRRDQALLMAAGGRGGSAARPTVLRLFRFDPPGITLGRSQDPARILDLERCRADGIPWAVRPTGGRAIFHAEEWTYSLTALLRDPAWGGIASVAYDRAARLVHASLVRLGIPAVWAPASERYGRRRAAGEVCGAGRGSGSTAPACFAATARHEILINGRKLVGSAQRRTARALLVQGSILLGPGHLRLADYLSIPERDREAAREALRRASADAHPGVGSDPPLERWAEVLADLLPRDTRRFDGEHGVFLLTPPENRPYTAVFV